MRLLNNIQSFKEFNLLDSLNAGLIPVISDAKCEPAAKQLVGPGEHGICDWHSQQCAWNGICGRLLLVFQPESDSKWQVCFALNNCKFALSLLSVNYGQKVTNTVEFLS